MKNQTIASLENMLKQLTREYTENGKTDLSDAAFDVLRSKLVALYDGKVPAKSVLNAVGAPPALGVTKTVTRKIPMESLANAFSDEDIQTFCDKVQQAYIEVHGKNARPKYLVEPKWDGLACELTYEPGKEVRASTRGDGTIGEDISITVGKMTDSIPRTIKFDKTLTIRGEIVMTRADMDKWNNDQTWARNKPLVSPRSAASGSVKKMNDPMSNEIRPLKFMPYAYVIDGLVHTTDVSITDAFPATKALTAFGGHESVVTACLTTLSYAGTTDDVPDTDGVVIKVKCPKVRAYMGSTSHHPRWAIARKWAPAKSITPLLSVRWSVGQSGDITPVAVLAPVQVGDVMVSSAQLFNMAHIKALDLMIGQDVYIHRAGEVVPELIGPVPDTIHNDCREIKAPIRCPSCGSKVVVEPKSSVVSCPYTEGCPEQVIGRLYRAFGKHGLDVKGLGVKTLQRFYLECEVMHPIDLLELDTDELIKGFGSALEATKYVTYLIAHEVPYNKFIFALAIPGVGKSLSLTLAKRFKTIAGLFTATVEELADLPDVSKESAVRISEFLQDEDNCVTANAITDHVRLSYTTYRDNAFSHKRVCVTGSFSGASRSEVTTALENSNAKVMSSLSKRADYLIMGSSGVGKKKTKAALDYGIELITEDEVYKILDL